MGGFEGGKGCFGVYMGEMRGYWVDLEGKRGILELDLGKWDIIGVDLWGNEGLLVIFRENVAF